MVRNSQNLHRVQNIFNPLETLKYILLYLNLNFYSHLQILDPMRGVVLDRFGLMHLIATNVCEWLNVVIQETRDDIMSVAYDKPALLRYANITGPPKIIVEDVVNITLVQRNKSTENITALTNLTVLTNMTAQSYTTMRNDSWSCHVNDMITPLLRTVNPYLRPCGVEYSLLCSIIIAVIWNDICTVPGSASTFNILLQKYLNTYVE